MAITPFYYIMMQTRPNLDSICALWLLKTTAEAEKKYPGIKTAAVTFWKYGTVSPDGKRWQDFMEKGTLPIGVLGGPLDEHPSSDFGDRKAKGESTTSLVAKDLGIFSHPLYAQLIRSITASDLKGAGSDGALHLAAIVKQMYRNGQDAVQFAFAAFAAIVASQQRFLDAREEIWHGVGVIRDKLQNGLEVLGINSDNDMIGPAVRYLRYAAVVQFRTGGHVLVLVNQQLVQPATADEIALEIRFAEITARRQSVDSNGHDEQFTAPGQLPSVPNWCYQVPGYNMLNGTETAPGVAPTAIDARHILSLVCRSLERQTGLPKKPTADSPTDS